MHNWHHRVTQFRYPAHVLADTFSPPRLWWDLVAGMWTLGSLRQTSPDVPAARTLLLKTAANPDMAVEARPELVDSTPRFLGLLVREAQVMTHIMLGAYYTAGGARLRAYKCYSGLPRTATGIALPALDACLADSCLPDGTPQVEVRGLSPRYTVKLYFHDGTSASYAVPAGATAISITVVKPVVKIEVYDATGRLQAGWSGLAGGLDVFVLGGPGLYVLLFDGPLSWGFGRTVFAVRSLGMYHEFAVAEQWGVAVDSEIYGPGLPGLRAYQAPSTFYRFVARRLA